MTNDFWLADAKICFVGYQSLALKDEEFFDIR